MLFSNIDTDKNNKVKEKLLKGVCSNKIAHSQLFYGTRNSPKLKVALAYAQYINCLNPTKKDSCDKCSSCLKYKKLQHPDLHFVFPVVNSGKKKPISDSYFNEWIEFFLEKNNASLDDWDARLNELSGTKQSSNIYQQEVERVIRKKNLKNFEAKFKVFLFWMLEKMQPQTANKILKTLEEPPEKTIFIFVSENPKLMLPTILSRLQKIKIQDNNQNQTKEQQKPNKKHHAFYQDFSFWMRAAYSFDVLGISEWAESQSKKTKKDQINLLLYATNIIRQCVIYNFTTKELFLQNKEESTFIKKFAPFINKKNIIPFFEKTEECIKMIKRNGNKKILFFELSLQYAKLLKIK